MKPTIQTRAYDQLRSRAPEILRRGSPDARGARKRTPPPGLHVLTPDIAPGMRIVLFVDARDVAKLGRGPGWNAMVTDVPTGARVHIAAAACELDCYCGARVTQVQRPLQRAEARTRDPLHDRSHA